jgi:hypothetical protein
MCRHKFEPAEPQKVGQVCHLCGTLRYQEERNGELFEVFQKRNGYKSYRRVKEQAAEPQSQTEEVFGSEKAFWKFKEG